VTVNQRRLKVIQFTLAGTAYDCQVKSWAMTNSTPLGDKQFSFCADGTGEFREETDPDYSLDLTFWADWRAGGINDYLTLNDQVTVAFQLDHHPFVVGEHVRWVGTCQLRAPNVGGEPRVTEQFETSFPVIGKPTYSRP